MWRSSPSKLERGRWNNSASSLSSFSFSPIDSHGNAPNHIPYPHSHSFSQWKSGIPTTSTSLSSSSLYFPSFQSLSFPRSFSSSTSLPFPSLSSSHSYRPSSSSSSPSSPTPYTLRIGLEIHVQLSTKSKLFSRGSSTLPSQLSPIDVSLPGTLPAPMNNFALTAAIRTAIAFKCTISPLSRFVRKHYKYADLPAGYQISQMELPVAYDGMVEVPSSQNKNKNKNSSSPSSSSSFLPIRLHRIQIEQDSGKSIHDVLPNSSCIDYTRCGSPLLEIVLHPDIYTIKDTIDTVLFIVRSMKSIGVTEGKMGDGHVRCDVNISIHNEKMNYNGERVEIKNLNSIKSIKNSIIYEYKRQCDMAHKGIPIVRETRSFDMKNNRTALLRSKENLLDYRFIEDPDLPIMRVSAKMIQKVQREMPPTLKHKYDEIQRAFEGKLSSGEVMNILNHYDSIMEIPNEICKYFPNIPIFSAYNFYNSDVIAQLKRSKVIVATGDMQNDNDNEMDEEGDNSTFQNNNKNHHTQSYNEIIRKFITPKEIGKLVHGILSKDIHSSTAKEILKRKIEGEKKEVDEIIEENQWRLEKTKNNNDNNFTHGNGTPSKQNSSDGLPSPPYDVLLLSTVEREILSPSGQELIQYIIKLYDPTKSTEQNVSDKVGRITGKVIKELKGKFQSMLVGKVVREKVGERVEEMRGKL